MKSIKYFKNNKESKKSMNKIFGGKIHPTGAFIDDCGTKEDEWDDKDNDGKFSDGDTICYNIPQEC